ncbi:transposase [bacterium]|nr:transposase [bacterium]
MPRLARIVIEGLPHHVTQRGNNRQDVFFTDADREIYLDLLRAETRRFGVAVMGYCLMTNHVHLIVIPENAAGLAKAMGRTHYRYAMTINRLHGRTGHIWQNRFFSCPLDRPHAWAALRYVERNPVRAKMTRVPWTYPWSSANAHCEGEDPRHVLDFDEWARRSAGSDWKAWLTEHDDPELIAKMRLSTHTGRPLASDSLLSKIESTLNRRLRPLPVGRPKGGPNK